MRHCVPLRTEDWGIFLAYIAKRFNRNRVVSILPEINKEWSKVAALIDVKGEAKIVPIDPN